MQWMGVTSGDAGPFCEGALKQVNQYTSVSEMGYIPEEEEEED